MRRVLVALLATVSLVFAASDMAVAKRVAFVVGNSAYQHTTPLANPAHDARDMAAALKALSFDVIEGFDLDKRSLDLKTRDFARAMAGADAAMFFYAGHGLQVSGQNYLVPIDAKLENERDLDFEATKVDFILRQMELEREGKTNIVFLDACRDNPLSRNLARSMGTRSAALGRGLAQVQTGVGTFIAFSTQPGNVALDGDGRNSPFTTALLKHMKSGGRSLNAVMIDVRKDVLAATNGRQVPWDHSALTGDFYFVPVATSPPRPAEPAAPGADVAALQQQMKDLEERLAKNNRTAAVNQADAIRIAELRMKVSNLEELHRSLHKKMFEKQQEQFRASTHDERWKISKAISEISMEMARRGGDLKGAREELAALEGAKNAARGELMKRDGLTASSKIDDSQIFASARVKGQRIDAGNAGTVEQCVQTCRTTNGCIGAAMETRSGICELFRTVETLTRDREWTAAVRDPAKN
jgi:uncharacterized caspase-like protein